MGYEVLTLNFRKPKKSDRYNFLQPIIDAMNEGDIPKAIDRTWDFASAIVPEAKEKIWENGEKSIMQGRCYPLCLITRSIPTARI
mgnify:CR=1 FL=1